ncbi:UNKNOWN [Stylonychia lemnae]|uniref:Uncharacterized protein n=1 Tax=Stylonychia lemnae TaxID=5949 RepID=A0A078B2P1_STYLE|nr:UNKNOWN [Stylonychia lemnae]|eukprot:CDW88805.1 UNKNOWN [Stylonychia lemnae]
MRSQKTTSASLIQVNNEVDLSYFKRMLEDTKRRLDQLSFIEQRAAMVGSISSLEDEITIAYDEIKKNEKDLNSIFSVAEFLFDNREDLYLKYEEEQQKVEDQKREIHGLNQKIDSIMEELTQKSQNIDRLNKAMQTLEKQIKDQRTENEKLKKKGEDWNKKHDVLKESLQQQIDKTQEIEETSQDKVKDYETRLQELQTMLNEYIGNNEKQTLINDEKDLEISRLRRENEDLQKVKKNSTEKIMEYQAINERLRKDKQILEDAKNELNKKMEMMEMLQKSAAMVMGKNDFEDENIGGGGLGGDLKDFEDMDNSFNGGELNNSNNNLSRSDQRDSRRGTFQMDLNQSLNSDQQEFQNKLFDMQQQYSTVQPEIGSYRNSLNVENNQIFTNELLNNIKPETRDFEIQTEVLQVTEKKIQTENAGQLSVNIQTDKAENKSIGIQAVQAIETSDQEIQTESEEEQLVSLSLNVFRFDLKPTIQVQLQQQSPIKKVENSQSPNKRISRMMIKPKGFENLQISMTDGNNEDSPKNELNLKQVPATEKADGQKKKFDLTQQSDFEQMRTAPSIQTPSSKSSFFMKDQLTNDYFMNRDPMKEFFALVSIILIS